LSDGTNTTTVPIVGVVSIAGNVLIIRYL